MISKMEKEIRKNYRIESENVHILAVRLEKIALEQGMTPMGFRERTLGAYRYLYHRHLIVGQPGLLMLKIFSRQIFIKDIKKVLILIDSASQGLAKEVEKRLIQELTGLGCKAEYQVFHSEMPEAKLININLLFLGDQPVAREFLEKEISCDFEQFQLSLKNPDKEKRVKKEKDIEINVLSPKEIYGKMDKIVLGQEEAKKSLSVILYQHLKRCHPLGSNISAANALLMGPSGCGKTFIAKTMADIVGLPFLKLDANAIVQRGYRGGMHVDQVVEMLCQTAKGNRWLGERAVIFIDEIDKLAYKGCHTAELATIGVQHDLLSIIDGGDFFYEDDDYSRGKYSFKNNLFLFGGAFQSLAGRESVVTEDICRYGFMPEFVGRMGNVIRLQALSEDILKRLTRREVERYKELLPMKPEEAHVYTEIIHSMLLVGGEHAKLGGRSVPPMVRHFFEDRLFDGKTD